MSSLLNFKSALIVAAWSIPLMLQSPVTAKQEAQKEMMRIGDEVVSLEAGKSFQKAQEFLDNSKYEQACDLLKQFLASYPNNAAAHYKYGFALLQEGKNTEALAQAKRCTELNANLFAGWALLGEAAANLKLNEQAKDAYDKALAIQPSGENSDIIREHLNDLKGSTQSEPPMVEDPELVKQNNIILKNNRAFALCNQANDLLKQKQFELGLQKCHDALKISPDLDTVKENVVIFLNNYASNCVQQQDLKRAESLMNEAVALQSKGGVTAASRLTTLRNYSALLKFSGRDEEAKNIESQMNSIK